MDRRQQRCSGHLPASRQFLTYFPFRALRRRRGKRGSGEVQEATFHQWCGAPPGLKPWFTSMGTTSTLCLFSHLQTRDQSSHFLGLWHTYIVTSVTISSGNPWVEGSLPDTAAAVWFPSRTPVCRLCQDIKPRGRPLLCPLPGVRTSHPEGGVLTPFHARRSQLSLSSSRMSLLSNILRNPRG